MSEFILGDYIFSRKRIGKGAFSTIYKCRHKHTHKIYAIKEISFDNLDKIRDSIKREFTLMKRLNHKNIIKLHDVFFDTDEKNIYLVIDYYQKGDLSKFLNGKALDEKYAKKYMRQLAEGLKYLYENKILHRDLKLQNILVTDSGDIVITDFGFARYFDNEIMLNTLCGSPMYMAPEIMINKKYNSKSDLWSLGVIFYELLYGDTPYSAKNMIDLMRKIKKKAVEIPNYKESVILSEPCKNLLLSLLERNPDKRINWDNFFSHEWFETDELLDEENNLMTISLSKSLPKQLFKHKSIRESENSELQFNLSMSSNNDEEDIENSNEYYDNKEDESNSDEEYSSASEYYVPIDLPKSAPININVNKYECQVVNSCEYKYMSEPIFNIEDKREGSFSDNFKTYLSSSINFLKQSYSYLSRKTI
jgi:serine/threonine protein kinase